MDRCEVFFGYRFPWAATEIWPVVRASAFSRQNVCELWAVPEGSWVDWRLASRLLPKGPEPAARRVLFLDDDPRRAETFLAEHPQAVWVETVVNCVERLRESWDEVHLDHDLGGQQHVDVDAVDCGMEVIRWMCKEPRDHLRSTQILRPYAQYGRRVADGASDAQQRLQGGVSAVRAGPGTGARAQRA